MFYVYVLSDENGNLYKGYTTDLRKRLKEHIQGKNFSTKGRLWKCIYYEACTEELDARRREKYLKTTQGGRLLKRRLKEHFYKQRVS
jgi:putative endonuclease